ncbi:hypothetical protein AKJ37_04735 [candidate division MSBL1 archaeon SCGC-AAA259I09]|uniref:ParB-like N-terminal domain-containing protein n=1 Tax=candidate division MSBL1 archaeon SCGC-AAA259I09 TaxID=1698267 RepID=A0A133UR66_9EURY|nr:hypothetical protein AKJ37_04735 [candidate division MSBL1 archaeon SCGC-AAA259I09]
MDGVEDLFSRISEEEAENLVDHFSRAWRSEELVPQPEGYILIPVDRIATPEDPVREDLGDLKSLKRSLERRGLLQPIVVRPLDDEWRSFEPIIGLRRYRACEELEREEIPAYVREVEDEEIPEIALEENRFRKQLTPVELLEVMGELRERGYTYGEIGKMADKDRRTVSAYLKIPELSEEIREAFFEGEITLRHVKTLLRLEGETRERLFERIMEEGLSATDAESVAKKITGKVETPSFFNRNIFEKMLGKGVDYRKTNYGTTLTIKTENERELEETLKQLFKSN